MAGRQFEVCAKERRRVYKEEFPQYQMWKLIGIIHTWLNQQSTAQHSTAMI